MRLATISRHREKKQCWNAQETVSGHGCDGQPTRLCSLAGTGTRTHSDVAQGTRPTLIDSWRVRLTSSREKGEREADEGLDAIRAMQFLRC